MPVTSNKSRMVALLDSFVRIDSAMRLNIQAVVRVAHVCGGGAFLGDVGIFYVYEGR